MSGSDVFALGIAAGALGLVLLLSLIIASAYDEPTLFFLAGYIIFIVALLLAAEHWQLAMGSVRNLLLLAGCLAVASLQIWVLRTRENSVPRTLVMTALGLSTAGLMIFCGVAGQLQVEADHLFAVLSLAWAVLMVSGVYFLTFRSWDAAGAWKWWLLLGQFFGLGVAVLFLANFVAMSLAFWPVVLMLLAQVPSIYVAMVWRSRLLNEIRLRGASAGVTDPLTGLATASVLIERLMRIQARTQPIKNSLASNALFLIEVQNWQGLLVELGADSNEKLLLEAAMRLRRSVGDNDLIARIYSGRFAVVAQGLASQKEIMVLATRLVVSGLRIDSPLLPGVELKFRIIVINLHQTAPLALTTAQAWLDAIAKRFVLWPSSHRSRSILVVEQDNDVTARFPIDSSY